MYMTIENLQVGQIVNSYKEMCRLLNEKERRQGTSRICQFKDWKRFFVWRREGYKFVIDEIYPIAKRKVDRRGNPKNYCNCNNIEEER